MPKKRFNKTLQTKPSSSPPAALAASTTSTSKHGQSAAASKSAPSSVNELINHLRQTQASDEQPHRLPHTPGAATVHPSLRNILSLPDTPPPAPRPGYNMMRSSGPTRTRRIPGPPPPASWLVASKHADTSQDRPVLTSRRVEQSSNLPGGHFPTQGSLQHTVLKSVATHLHWLLEYDSVISLPTQLKQTILSYVAVYHEEPEGTQYETVNPFRLLFPKISTHASLTDASADDNSEVTRLDLSGSIGRWLSMKDFKEMLSHVNVVRKEPDVLPDSWDHEGEPSGEELGVTGGAMSGADAVAAAGPRSASFRFSNLVHLSLALSPTTSPLHKRAAASWFDLLKVAPFLSRLSSLSLAHWPSPTLTPHAASTYTTIKNPVSSSLPGIPYGGSDMYTSLDGDWKEAANLLKMFSRHLYCLHWLDLTGCGDWFAALSVANSADWTGAWRGIERVGLGVGWSPELPKHVSEPDSHSVRCPITVPSQTSNAVGMRGFATNRVSHEMHDDGQDRNEHLESAQKYYYEKAVEEYAMILSVARGVASSIHATRRGQGKWIEFDLSPELPTVQKRMNALS